MRLPIKRRKAGQQGSNMSKSRMHFLKASTKSVIVALCTRYTVTKFRLLKGNRVQFGSGFVSNGRLQIKGPGRVIFGTNVNAWAHKEPNVLITYRPDVVIQIGDNTRLNGAGLMAACGITVGCHCIVGSAVMVDTDFHSIDPDRHTNPDAKVRSAPITIGNNVWLAGQTVVLKGVTIGENSVVGFRGVVTSNVPPNVIVAGNPVRIVKQLGA
jgi:acetyltransferase-like isoleucine patch superfamily enzyme